MAKSSKARKAKAASPSKAATESSLRRARARLDREILKAINERAKVAVQLAKRTQAGDQPQVEPDQPSLDELVESNKGPLGEECVRTIFRELASGTKALCGEVRVAYLGPAYSYSHLATLYQFGSSFVPQPVGSIGAVFEEVNRGQADFGLVPLENSTDGRIADTLDMFTRLRVSICGEVQMRIHHSLLGKGTRAEVKEIYSRPQALSQCRHWLSKHLPAARLVEVASTTTAAQLAQEKPGAAAIASAPAGVHYGLDVLAENVEDNQANITRFAVIGQQSAPRTSRDKMALMFEVEHRPGALADAMAIFKRNRLNLTWIESFPIARPEGGYLFFIELDGHELDARVKRAIASLEKRTLRLEILGSYPRTEPVG